MKTAIKIFIVYMGFYLLSSGSINVFIKIFKSTSIELSVMDLCEDTDEADEETKNEDGKNEHKLIQGFDGNIFQPLFIYTDNAFPLFNYGKPSTTFTEIVPPPPKG
jgi:hypothetical protein